MVGTKKLLPQNPCSIAGKMRLLVHSELCNIRRVIPIGAEWLAEGRRSHSGCFVGWRFSLGWWSGGPVDNRWYGIDIGRAEKME